jgi:hypothetical protein
LTYIPAVLIAGFGGYRLFRIRLTNHIC